jgi:protein PhnA
METKDSNGNVIVNGDSVTLTKSLKVKGMPKDVKQGTLVKNIKLTNNPDEIEGKVNGTMLVIKTAFIKKR